MGDGYVYENNGRYQIGIVGNPTTDKEYFSYLKDLIFQEFGVHVKIKYRSRGLRIVFRSKEVVHFLLNDLEMIFGKDKSESTCIPYHIRKNGELVKSTIRGIIDTDGSIFVADKPGSPRYPSIEIKTCSYRLAHQLRDILKDSGFRVANIWSVLSKNSKRTAYTVPLNGKKNVKNGLMKSDSQIPIKCSVHWNM